ncbi:MAG: glycosyltransferase [Prevotella sp.]|nr:glycosyltransferase [Prevotella sp.]
MAISESIIYKIRRECYKYLVDHFPRIILDRIWKKDFGYTVNWEHPRDLNEKIEWLICYGDTKMWPQLADKYKVREYVTQRGYGHILPQLYGVWNDASKIDFSKLPEKFILKCNHDSGSYHIVNKQEGYDPIGISEKMNRYLNEKFGYRYCEPHYNKIKPLVIAEEFFEAPLDTNSTSLIDYKVWCFDGNPYCIFTCSNRSHKGIDINVFDLDWHVHPEYAVFSDHYRDGNGEVPKPMILNNMLEVASSLSKGLPQARVDFYIIDH